MTMEVLKSAAELFKLIELSSVPMLSRNEEELQSYTEYYDLKNTLDHNFPPLIEIMRKTNFSGHPEFNQTILPKLLVLYLERSSSKVWNSDNCLKYTKQLNAAIQNMYKLSLDSVLMNNDICDCQQVFDGVFMELNKKLCTNDFKRYPSLIDVYSNIMIKIKSYKVIIKPQLLFPVTMHHIDDYVDPNKIKGLKWCLTLISLMSEKDFEGGNYHEVILNCLKKSIREKELDILKLLHQCFLELIKIVPCEDKVVKTDEIFSIMLEQIYFETNLHRKKICLMFINDLMAIHGVNCTKYNLLKSILHENIQVCCHDAVADILLIDVLQCLQLWIEHCWCVWRLSSDHKILSGLIKLLYVSRKEKNASDIQHIIVSLVLLCSKDDQKTICENLKQSQITSPEFMKIMDEIIKDIS